MGRAVAATRALPLRPPPQPPPSPWAWPLASDRASGAIATIGPATLLLVRARACATWPRRFMGWLRQREFDAQAGDPSPAESVSDSVPSPPVPSGSKAAIASARQVREFGRHAAAGVFSNLALFASWQGDAAGPVAMPQARQATVSPPPPPRSRAADRGGGTRSRASAAQRRHWEGGAGLHHLYYLPYF